MRRIVEAAAAQLARRSPDDVPMTADEAFRLLARIARTGPAAARLRAVELLGARIGLFQDAPGVGPPSALSDDERAERIDAILERARRRRAIARGHGDDVAGLQEDP